MNADVRQGLIELLRTQGTAALATLHKGEPAISMVPVALDDVGLLIHVSQLAPHTRDLREHPRASLLLMGAQGELPQARPRVSITGEAAFIDKDTTAYEVARARYLARFPRSEMTFGLADFSLVRIAPHSARYVAGFAQAHAIAGLALAALLRAASA